MPGTSKIADALQILSELEMPRAQRNDRSALCLLALLNLTPEKRWAEAASPLIGITPIMEFAREHYGRKYAPNSRETFRRQTMHQFMAAGIARYNPDQPGRAVNSPSAVYQIERPTLKLLRCFGTAKWSKDLDRYLKTRPTLIALYATGDEEAARQTGVRRDHPPQPRRSQRVSSR